MRIEPVKCLKQEFPISDLTTEGMNTIEPVSEMIYSDVFLNIVYAVKDEQKLHLEVITPPGVFPDDITAPQPNQKYPAIVYCVGSAWFEQNMGRKITRMTPFANRGYVIVLVEYRPSTVAPFPAQIKDFKTAIRFITKHAKDYAIDPERICAWGDSSGGHTVTMTNVTWDDPEYNDEDSELQIKAFVDFYGPTDITKMNDTPSIMEHMTPDSPEGMLIGGRRVDQSRDWTDKVNPMNYLSPEKSIRPQLILHGNRDRLVPFSQSVKLYKKMKECGCEVEFYRLLGLDHAEDAFYTKPVFDIVQAFLEKYI